MSNKTMWFHHLSIVWNVISTVLTVGFVVVWLWYGLTLEIGRKESGFHFLYHSNAARDTFQDFRNTFFNKSSPWGIYTRKTDEIKKRVDIEREAGIYTEERAEHYKAQLDQAWEDYKKSDQYRYGKVYKKDSVSEDSQAD